MQLWPSRAMLLVQMVAKLVQLCGSHIVVCVIHIINKCLVTGYFPQCLQQSVVVPMPVLSKGFRRILKKLLNEYVQRNDNLSEMQSGFRRQYSCNTAFLPVVDDVIKAANLRHLTLVSLLGFSKAFDIIKHNLMQPIWIYVYWAGTGGGESII